jgi:hypothetical protein
MSFIKAIEHDEAESMLKIIYYELVSKRGKLTPTVDFYSKITVKYDNSSYF